MKAHEVSLQENRNPKLMDLYKGVNYLCCEHHDTTKYSLKAQNFERTIGLPHWISLKKKTIWTMIRS